jgi:hypothetical protein
MHISIWYFDICFLIIIWKFNYIEVCSDCGPVIVQSVRPRDRSLSPCKVKNFFLHEVETGFGANKVSYTNNIGRKAAGT